MNNATYFIAAQAAPTEEACTFVALDARMVPAILSGIVRYISPAAWLSDEDWHRGYQKSAKAMEALLSDCGTVIVNNIIAARGIDPAAPRDPVYGTPLAPAEGTTLLDIFATLQGARGTPGAALDAIATAAELGAQNTAEGLGVGSDDGLLLELLLLAL